MERLARSLSTVPVALQAAATVGLDPDRAGWRSAVVRWGAPDVSQVPASRHGRGFRGRDQPRQILTMAVALLPTLVLAVFFKVSRLGVAMRGVVDDPTLLAMTGISPIAVRRAAWVVGSIFVCLSGVLLAPSVNLDSMVLTLLVVQSFGAAAIGRFSNIPLTYVGGLAIGVGAALITRYVSGTSQYLAGLSQSIPFIVLFVVLIVTPRSKLVDRRINLPRPTRVWRAPARIQVVGSMLMLVVLVTGPSLVRCAAVVVHRRARLRLALLVAGPAGQELEPGLARAHRLCRHRVRRVLGGPGRMGASLVCCLDRGCSGHHSHRGDHRAPCHSALGHLPGTRDVRLRPDPRDHVLQQ